MRASLRGAPLLLDVGVNIKPFFGSFGAKSGSILGSPADQCGRLAVLEESEIRGFGSSEGIVDSNWRSW